jgi:hypothetical protein
MAPITERMTIAKTQTTMQDQALRAETTGFIVATGSCDVGEDLGQAREDVIEGGIWIVGCLIVAKLCH